MPKSRHRKNQKEKSRARTRRVQSEQNYVQKKFNEYFQQEMEKLKNRELEIEEAEVIEETDGK
jgi:hypothetical protein